LAYAEAALELGEFVDAEGAARRLTETNGAQSADRAVGWIRLGDALHGQKRHREAFQAYARGKAEIEHGHRDSLPNGNLERPLDRAVRLAKELAAIDPARWRVSDRGAPSTTSGPVFLLGFPRSGTTLLEEVLASSDDVLAIDERPTLDEAEEAFLTDPGGLERLAGASEDTLDGYRASYWERVRAFVGEPGNRVLLDKQPTRTASLPLIARLFPTAKVLFAIRDPRDVVLSCFRHAFAVNRWTYAFVSLQGAAQLYDATMRLALAYRAALPLDIREVRHEALVTDFESETRALFGYLGVEWTREIESFATRAKDRPIRTPSANQIRRGLNTSGFGRWRNYEQELAPVLPILKPWIERLGYADD
jgi:hypothetical protein